MKGFHLFQVIHFVAYFIVGLWGEGEGGGGGESKKLHQLTGFISDG